MLEEIANKSDHDYEWIDLFNPSRHELEEIGSKYELHAGLINDALQHDHLPKFERMEKYAFIIFRMNMPDDQPNADHMEKITVQMAIFYSEEFLITVHFHKREFLNGLIKQVKNKNCCNTLELVNSIVYACLNTFEKPLKKLAKEVEYFEEVVFLRPKKSPLLKGLYFLKRKVDLMHRIILLSSEIIETIDANPGNVNTRDTRDLYVKIQSILSSFSDNIHQLLNIYFSAASQRTNETMRILTIFSVFFMPLTFIVGVYGMNFDVMPELKWRLGYPGVMFLMALITFLIYIWFKKKEWL